MEEEQRGAETNTVGAERMMVVTEARPLRSTLVEEEVMWARSRVHRHPRCTDRVSLGSPPLPSQEGKKKVQPGGGGERPAVPPWMHTTRAG